MLRTTPPPPTYGLPGGELHLEEAGKEVNDKNHGVFMWGEGRQVTGEKC